MRLLSDARLKLGELRQLSWSGVSPGVRCGGGAWRSGWGSRMRAHGGAARSPAVWRVLSGYLPVNVDRRSSVLERKRAEYRAFVEQAARARAAAAASAGAPDAMLHQIEVDVLRTTPRRLFAQDTTKAIFERMLYVFHCRHPGSGYVQGMNDLFVPFFGVFLSAYAGADFEGARLSELPAAALAEIEADTYWCTSQLIDKVQDYFTADRPGLQAQVAALEGLMDRIDPVLSRHLERHGVPYMQFAFRWMNCLLMRELPLRAIIRLWDSYLAEDAGFEALHLYVCAAFLKTFANQVLAADDMSEIMLLVLNWPTAHWTERDSALLLAEAFRLKFTFDQAFDSHVRNSTTPLRR